MRKFQVFSRSFSIGYIENSHGTPPDRWLPRCSCTTGFRRFYVSDFWRIYRWKRTDNKSTWNQNFKKRHGRRGRHTLLSHVRNGLCKPLRLHNGRVIITYQQVLGCTWSTCRLPLHNARKRKSWAFANQPDRRWGGLHSVAKKKQGERFLSVLIFSFFFFNFTLYLRSDDTERTEGKPEPKAMGGYFPFYFLSTSDSAYGSC